MKAKTQRQKAHEKEQEDYELQRKQNRKQLVEVCASLIVLTKTFNEHLSLWNKAMEMCLPLLHREVKKKMDEKDIDINL